MLALLRFVVFVTMGFLVCVWPVSGLVGRLLSIAQCVGKSESRMLEGCVSRARLRCCRPVRWGNARWYIVDDCHFDTAAHRRGMAFVRRMLDGDFASPDLSPLGGEEYFLSVAEGRSGFECLDSGVACLQEGSAPLPSVGAVSARLTFD